MSGRATILDALTWRAEHQRDLEAYTFLVDGETQEESLTYGEVSRRARGVGAQLQRLGVTGDRALILCPAGLDYVAALYGCIASGFVAVPAYAPTLGREIERLRRMAASALPRVGITTEAALPAVLEACAAAPELSGLKWIMADGLQGGSEDDWHQPHIGPDSLAILVYTSGSTSEPKGVMLAHYNIPSANLDPASLERGRRQRIMSWSAPHTAGGISRGFLVPMCEGTPATLMAPEAFWEHPARWIFAMSRSRATSCSCPNIAYDLAIEAIPPEQRSHLDLSCLRWAFNGGEQVRADTIERFEEAFASSGLRHGTVLSAYGLTEAGGISASTPGKRPNIVAFERNRLEAGVAIPVPRRSLSARVLVGQGMLSPTGKLRIVDPDSLVACPPGGVGEVWVAGPNVVPGYWNRPRLTAETFDAYVAGTDDGPYFRTGDFGFLHEGELFITGRLKEVIIIRGRNIYANDVELTARKSVPDLEGQSNAAFAVEEAGEERLVIVQEVVRESDPSDLSTVADALRRAVAVEIGIQAYAVVLVPAGAIPRTASGKIRRAACRAAFSSGELQVLYRSVRGDERRRRLPYVPPQTDVEGELVAIWEAVLGVSPIGIADSFIDLGGDSLRSLQIAARMRERGMTVGIEQINQSETIAALARLVGTRAVSPLDQEPVVGRVPMLLMQRGVLRGGQEIPSDLMHDIWFVTTERIDPDLMDRAAQHVVFYHDALRMRFRFTGWEWEAHCVGQTPGRIVHHVDLTILPSAEIEPRLEGEIARLKSRLNITHGPLLQIAILHFGGTHPDRVVVLLPHLVFDAFSLPMLVADLERVYVQLQAGEPVRLPPKTTSIKRWGEALESLFGDEQVREAVKHWQDVLRDPPAILSPDVTPDSEPGERQYTRVTLGANETEQLLRLTPHRDGFQLGDALVYAVGRTVADRTGRSWALIDIFDHGRIAPVPDIDLSRTLGYFTILFPVRVEVGSRGGPLEACRQLRRQLDRIPGGKISFQALRYLSTDPLCYRLTELDRLIRLNYTGQVSGLDSGMTLFRPQEQLLEDVGRPAERSQYLEIVAAIADGVLDIRLDYHSGVYHAGTARALVEDMRGHLAELAALSASNADVYGYAP